MLDKGFPCEASRVAGGDDTGSFCKLRCVELPEKNSHLTEEVHVACAGGVLGSGVRGAIHACSADKGWHPDLDDSPEGSTTG